MLIVGNQGEESRGFLEGTALSNLSRPLEAMRVREDGGGAQGISSLRPWAMGACLPSGRPGPLWGAGEWAEEGVIVVTA